MARTERDSNEPFADYPHLCQPCHPDAGRISVVASRHTPAVLTGRGVEESLSAGGQGAASVSDEQRRAFWQATGLSLTAHTIMLRDVAIIDDLIAAALLTAIDGVTRGDPPAKDGSLQLVAAFAERVDNLLPAAPVGAIRIARGRHDVAASSQRILLRDGLLSL